MLINEGHAELVAALRPVQPVSEAENPLQRLGKAEHSQTYSPFSFRQIVEFVLLLPLNLVPWIGVPLFLWLTGYRAGPLQHHRYFKQKSMAKKERKELIRQRRLGYTSYVFRAFYADHRCLRMVTISDKTCRFGAMALVLQLVPVLSMPFLMTSAAGSALWAARIENELMSPTLEDEPPAYEDDPS